MLDYLQKMFEMAAIDFLRLWLSPGSRSFWAFMVPSIAAAAWMLWRDDVSGREIPEKFRTFSAATWLSRSAINDYGLVLVNAVILGCLLAPFEVQLADGQGGAWLSRLLGSWVGPLGTSPTWWAPVVLALALFIVDDIVRFGMHWLEHRVPPMWELHKVHHSAEVLNFITAERHHPLSALYTRLVSVIATGITNGVFLWVFADKISPWKLMGANGFWIASNMLFSTLRHSPCWISFGPTLERWVISPAQHQVHHSANPAHFDKNLGGTLAIWDRLFGTLHVTGPEREVTDFGLGDETVRYRSFATLYSLPMVRALGLLLPRRNAAAAAPSSVSSLD